MNEKKHWRWLNGKVVLSTVFILALVGGGYFWKRKMSPQISYQEQRVERGSLNLSVLSTGTVQPENRLEIKPPIPGRVEKVLVQEGQKVRKGELLAWMSSTERAALLDAALSKGVAELKRWEEYYRPTPVVSPISGTIILRSVEPGQTFTSSDPIFAISNRLTVKAQVDETDMAQIKTGLPATIILDAYPEQKIQGTVDRIAFEAKTVNNVTTYEVDVLPQSIPDFMRSGMTANVTFSIGSRENILIIENEVIKYEGDKMMVLVPHPGGPPRPQEIKTGLTNGKWTEVLSGLQEGDTILVPELFSPEGTSNKGTSPFSFRRGGGNSKGARRGH